jgi:hypothetical protein
MKQLSLFVASRLISLGALVLSAGAGAQQFSGLINDYSPSTVKSGPWEMHGQWTLSVNPWTSKADFTADMTMSGYGRTSTNAVDPTQPGVNPHTHHIKMTDVSVTWNTTGCPANSPVTYGGFQITAKVNLITGNGSNAPFETSYPPPDVLQVCVSGGQGNGSIPFSNITLAFLGTSPAIGHFGPQPIHGVVREWKPFW